MKEEDVNRCQIQEWYPKFKPVSIRTVIHELPESFVEYLFLSQAKMPCQIEFTTP
jgi:hypothetical protein